MPNRSKRAAVAWPTCFVACAPRTAWIALPLLLVCLAALSPTVAGGQRDNAAELAKLRERIGELTRTLESTRSQLDDVRAELRGIERQIGSLVHSLKDVDSQLRERSDRLRVLRAEQREHQREIGQQRGLLGEQMRAAYMVGRQEYVKLLLNQEDPAAAGRVFTYYQYFNRARAQRIDAVNRALEKLTAVERAIEEQTSALAGLRARQQQEKAALEETYRGRSVVMAKLDREVRSGDKELERLRENERQLQQVLEAINEALTDIPLELEPGAGFASSRGSLSWPARGSVNQLFGTRREKSRVIWNGVIIDAPEGVQVHAVSYGRVAFADWLRGYGLLMIIDHGNGYMTLYGHAQSLYKEAGDWVEHGELIASVGRSGGRANSGLYFEIRHNGKPLNPVQWCRRGRSG